MSTPIAARTYNQNHVPRKYTPGRLRGPVNRVARRLGRGEVSSAVNR